MSDLSQPQQSNFSAFNAMRYIEEQVAFGPRVPGEPGHERTLVFMTNHFSFYAEEVVQLPFSGTIGRKHDFKGVNLRASFNLHIQPRIMLSAHWDTRPVSDNDPLHPHEPTLGANDGGSGVAVLMEFARVMHQQKLPYGIDIVLFDLEDSGNLNGFPFALGAESFVKQYPEYRPDWGINFDMVCDKHLRIPKENYSLRYAADVIDKVWHIANDKQLPAFINKRGGTVYDDHVPFLMQGIKIINLIHYPFPDTWHTQNDIPENCSLESLQQMGDLLHSLFPPLPYDNKN